MNTNKSITTLDNGRFDPLTGKRKSKVENLKSLVKELSSFDPLTGKRKSKGALFNIYVLFVALEFRSLDREKEK